MTDTATNAPARNSALVVGASLLALLVAGMYFAIGLELVADDFQAPPTPVMLIAGLAYLVGAAVIPRADRRLLTVGAVVNVVVLLLFVASAARGNSTVDAFSLGGKAVQLLLEAALVLMIRRA